MRRINDEGRALIKRFEGLRLKAYLCPAGVLTIGWGHTKGVRKGQSITEHQAEAILDVDLDQFQRDVEFLTAGIPLNDNEFSALVSFAFNVGSDIDDDTTAEGLGDSTLLRKLRAGDKAGAAAEFLKWTHANGGVSPGLVKRRAAERALFLKAG